MSGIQFLASSKPFVMLDEMEEYNNRGIYEEPNLGFSVYEIDHGGMRLLGRCYRCHILMKLAALAHIISSSI